MEPEKTSHSQQTSSEQILLYSFFCAFAECKDRLDVLRRALSLVREFSGFESVAIRMKEGKDFPFAVSDGFSADFLAQENSLLDSFSPCSGGCGNLSCYCGQTINDGIYKDAEKVGLNPARELPSADDGGQIFGKRGTCWKKGYQSLVRIPLRDSGNVFGLLLLNDPRPGLLTPEMKEKLSSIAFVLSVCLCSHDLTTTRQELDSWRQSLQRSRAEFLTLVNHELRTPLSGLLSVLELLRGELSKEDHNTLLNTARGCAEDLFAKVKNLLATSKLSAGKHIFSPDSFSPAEVLNGVCAKFFYKAKLKGLELVVNVSDSVPRAFINDENAFRKIVFNLVDNALKFTQKGKISVSLAQEPGSSQLLLTVWDTGCGFVSPASESRYFEPFCLLESIYTRQHDGLGLGLPVASGLLRAMGGNILIESNPGMGCLVSCRFPELSMPGTGEENKEFGDFSAVPQTVENGGFSLFNPEKVLFKMGGDSVLLRDVAALGVSEIPVKMSALVAAVSGSDWKAAYQNVRDLLDITLPLEIKEFSDCVVEISLLLKNGEYCCERKIISTTDNAEFRTKIGLKIRKLFGLCGIICGELTSFILDSSN